MSTQSDEIAPNSHQSSFLSGKLPQPSESYEKNVVCLCGKLVKEGDQEQAFNDPHQLLRNENVVHSITGMWSSGLDFLLSDPDNTRGLCNRFEYEHKSSSPNASFPVSGRYSGWFDLNNEEGGKTKISEKVTLRFRKNNAGYHNVEGKGSNAFGKYTITGTLTKDNVITIFRHFLVKTVKTAAAAKVTAAAAAVDATSDVISDADAAKEKETVELIEKAEAIMNQFPKSDMYFQAMADTDNISAREEYELLKEGATEDGCIFCMFHMGKMTTNTPDGKCMQTHMALPWFLEGAIRGSVRCILTMMEECYNNRGKKTDALLDYWGKITKRNKLPNLGLNKLKNHLGRKCVICSKPDTKTLTLQQCIGCSFYCYCSEGCQTIHWKEHKHRNECKQVRILNKYHKPYFNEIRDAVIRGDKEIPSLEKLRYKLGLTRPQEEYDEFKFYGLKPTRNGNPIDPDDYLVGREDGTLWVGSVPNSPIGSICQGKSNFNKRTILKSLLRNNQYITSLCVITRTIGDYIIVVTVVIIFMMSVENK
jgi:hypothetical protein